MLDELLTNQLRQADGDRVSDLSRHRRHTPLENESLRERLQTSGLSNTNGPVLFWVTEASIRIARAPGSQPRCRGVPRHPTIDIAVSRKTLVAMELKVFRPISVATAFRRRFDTLHVTCRKISRSVIWHLLVLLPRPYPRKMGDPVPNRIVSLVRCSRAVRLIG